MNRDWALAAFLMNVGCDDNLIAPAGVQAEATWGNATELNVEYIQEEPITAERYSQLENGMTYDQVARILGSDGEEVSSSDLGGTSTRMYAWKNGDGSNMSAMFQNGALVMKAQFGLP